MRLGRGLRERSWVGWAATLFTLLVLGMAVPVDVLGLDDSCGGGQSADTPPIAEIVQVKAIRLTEEGLLSNLSGPPLPSSVPPAVLDARRTIPDSAVRLTPLLGHWILPRAHLGREVCQANTSTIDPGMRPGQPSMMGHAGPRLPPAIVGEGPDG
jgi:hypothetical protein